MNGIRDRSLPAFFLLVFVLSVPLWVIGAVTGWQVLPGLPAISVLMAFWPAAAALVVVSRREGAAGVAALLKRSLDFKRIRRKSWYFPIFLFMPAVLALSYVVMRLLGRQLPGLHVPPLAASAMLVAFFIAGLGEEVGWSGYAIDPLQERWGALGGGVLLGLIWAAWHFVSLVLAGRRASWIAWWSLGTVALRIIHTWLFNNTGKSVFGQALFHAVWNLSWQLFPESGSHYDPGITGPILVVAAAIVTIIWGPRTLAGHGRPAAPADAP